MFRDHEFGHARGAVLFQPFDINCLNLADRKPRVNATADRIKAVSPIALIDRRSRLNNAHPATHWLVAASELFNLREISCVVAY